MSEKYSIISKNRLLEMICDNGEVSFIIYSKPKKGA